MRSNNNAFKHYRMYLLITLYNERKTFLVLGIILSKIKL